jgi:hypothetical protein
MRNGSRAPFLHHEARVTRQSMRRFSFPNAVAIRKAIWIAAGLRPSQ